MYAFESHHAEFVSKFELDDSRQEEVFTNAKG